MAVLHLSRVVQDSNLLPPVLETDALPDELTTPRAGLAD